MQVWLFFSNSIFFVDLRTKFGLFIPIGKVSHPVLWVAYLALSERGLYPRITSQIWQSDETLGNVPLCFPKDCRPCPWHWEVSLSPGHLQEQTGSGWV